MADSDIIPKSTQKKRSYCCICSNFRGKVVDGKTITIHRFPKDDKLKKSWIKRLKTVSQTFKLKNNDRLCSAHFVDGTFSKNEIPSVFVVNNKQKVFQTSKGDEVETFHESTVECVEDEYANLPLRNEHSAEHASVLMHDYCHGVPPLQTANSLPKDTQTVCEVREISVQTELTTVKTFVNASTQTDSNEVTTQDIGIQTKKPDIVIEDITSTEMCMFYTGLPNTETFHMLFNELDDAEKNTNRCGDGEKKGRPRSLRLIDEFFMVLIRLRLGLLLEDLAFRFRISKSSCSKIVSQWISYLSVKLSSLVPWPSKLDIQTHMPLKFQKKYPNCRVIIDCTEFFTENPQSLAAKTVMYSHYKSHMTWKALIGITPTGIISFVSDLWSGGISDKQITQRSGILDQCQPGDAIMADKGFLISELTTPRGLHLIIPPMKFQRFNRRQVEETRRIANLRIDVERAMERIKNFRILQGVMPITLSKQASQMLKICCGLSNLLPPLVQDN